MKKSNKNISILRIFLFSLLIFSCNKFDDLKSPIDGFKVIIDYDIFDTFLSFRFVDAASGDLIGGIDDEKVEIAISGASSKAVVDQLGNHEEKYNSVYGLLSLALNPKDPWVPSAENVLSLQIEATNENYKPTHLEIEIDSTGKNEYIVMMEKNEVDELGVKTYTFKLNLDENRNLVDNFNFTSTDHEVTVSLNQGTQFQLANGALEQGKQITFKIIVYNLRSKIPVSSSLLANVISGDGITETKALDLYRSVELLALNNKLDTMTSLINFPMNLRYKIDSTVYHPVSQVDIEPGNNLHTYFYQAVSKTWQLNENKILLTDSLGYYIDSEIQNFSLHAAGMHIGVCKTEGEMLFNLEGIFAALPVPARVYLYRTKDTRYVSNVKVDVVETGFQQSLAYNAPENTPVRFVVNVSTNTNSFVAKPRNFYFEPGCGAFGINETTLTSTSVVVSGKVKINFTEVFPDPEFEVYADFYRKSNNSLLWRKKYKISSTENEIEIETGLPACTEVYLKLLPITSGNSFESNPASIDLNTSAASDQIWNFNLSPLFSNVDFNFQFKRATDLPNEDYLVRVDFIDASTKKVVDFVSFTVTPDQTAYSAQMFLSKKIDYKVKMKRDAGSSDFMVYPFEFRTGNTLQREYNYVTELSAVVIKTATLTLKVVCSQSEIVPTLHAYYKTVWEDEWKECDIIEGILTLECEMNATYEIGLIVEGKMEVTSYEIKETDADFIFELSEAQCNRMGW